MWSPFPFTLPLTPVIPAAAPLQQQRPVSSGEGPFALREIEG